MKTLKPLNGVQYVTLSGYQFSTSKRPEIPTKLKPTVCLEGAQREACRILTDLLVFDPKKSTRVWRA